MSWEIADGGFASILEAGMLSLGEYSLSRCAVPKCHRILKHRPEAAGAATDSDLVLDPLLRLQLQPCPSQNEASSFLSLKVTALELGQRAVVGQRCWMSPALGSAASQSTATSFCSKCECAGHLRLLKVCWARAAGRLCAAWQGAGAFVRRL